MRYIGHGVNRGDTVQGGQKRFQVYEFTFERKVEIIREPPIFYIYNDTKK